MQTIQNTGWRVGFTVVSLLLSGVHAFAQRYAVTDLGTLSGNKVSAAYALNSSGEVAGASSSPTADIATVFSAGQAMNIDTLGAGVSLATSINASGQMAGYFFGSGPTFNPQAFLFSNGSMKDINSASVFPLGTEAWGINNTGQIVGTGYITSSRFHAFLYSNGKMTDLGPRGSFQATAAAINNSGQIVGSYSLSSGANGSFLYTNGKITQLPVPAGVTDVSAFAINDNGDIAGAFYFTGTPSHAAKYSNGVWTDLGAIAGAAGNTAKGINIAGQVVGTAVFPQTQYHPPKPGKHVPFIYSGGVLVDLNTLIASGTGFTITDALGINDSGQIVCDATNASGNEQAVLLTQQ